MKNIPTCQVTFIAFACFLLNTSIALFGQPNASPDPNMSQMLPAGKHEIAGKITDASSGFPLAYASVTLLGAQDSLPVTGALTDDKGAFSFEAAPGKYFARIEYLGYQTYYVPNIELTPSNAPLQLGTIVLQPGATSLDEVVIQAEKSSMQMTLDKKVFNMGKDLGTSGGTASDILSNIPSVQVGSDGAVSLRGSENVRILIDGKPSGLLSFKGADGLRQLQASMIDKVEIITNPSARYEAEGMGGIINIVLKKERTKGINGSFDLTAGYPQNFGVGINMNYRTNKLNFFGGYSPSYRNTPNVNSQYQEVYTLDTTNITRQISENSRISWDHNFRFGADYFFNPKNALTTSLSYNYSRNSRFSDLTYRDFLNSESNPTSITTRSQNEVETEPNFEYALSYKKTFGREGHELNAEFRYQDNWEDSDQLFTENSFLPNGTTDGNPTILQQNVPCAHSAASNYTHHRQA